MFNVLDQYEEKHIKVSLWEIFRLEKVSKNEFVTLSQKVLFYDVYYIRFCLLNKFIFWFEYYQI